MERRCLLGELKKGMSARITQVGQAAQAGLDARTGGDTAANGPETAAALANRLLAMGLLEGSIVELVHEAPFGGDPIAVRVRGALIALRRNEANLIQVMISEAVHE